MNVEVHAPSTLVLVVSLVLAVLALLCYFLVPAAPIGFWIAILVSLFGDGARHPRENLEHGGLVAPTLYPSIDQPRLRKERGAFSLHRGSGPR